MTELSSLYIIIVRGSRYRSPNHADRESILILTLYHINSIANNHYFLLRYCNNVTVLVTIIGYIIHKLRSKNESV